MQKKIKNWIFHPLDSIYILIKLEFKCIIYIIIILTYNLINYNHIITYKITKKNNYDEYNLFLSFVLFLTKFQIYKVIHYF